MPFKSRSHVHCRLCPQCEHPKGHTICQEDPNARVKCKSAVLKCDLSRHNERHHVFVRCNFSYSGLWFYLPSEIHVCCLAFGVVGGTDGNCNFSAVR
jgi:hypothetical protein